MSVFSKWASTMPLKYDMAKLTFLRSSEKARGRSLKLSCNWTRKVRNLVVSVPSKGSGSQTFEQEPSPWCCTFLANVAINYAEHFLRRGGLSLQMDRRDLQDHHHFHHLTGHC